MKRYFRHYKGNLYEYLGEANHSETLEEMVIYQAQYGEHKIWVRPKKMFFEDVTLADGTVVKRFEEVQLKKDNIRAMTEFEKMRHGEFYDYTNDEGNASNMRARQVCARLQYMTLEDQDYRKVMEELIPGIPTSTIVNPPFHCDHGHGIRLGENVFINYNATMLDGGMISIGDNCQIGPNCQLVTPNHPIDYVERRKPIERCLPITIGNDCWLGAGVIVCPGVTIGDRCVIGAGSVVVKDIPSDSMAVGNPARVIKKLVSENRDEQFQSLLEGLLKTFTDKGYTAEDFYGGCTLCGDANEFALDIIDAAVKQADPTIIQEDLNKTTDRLYRELHKLLSETN